MTSSDLKQKELNKKSSLKYYQKNKEVENKKACEHMRKLRFDRAVEKIMAELKAAREGNSSAKWPKESCRSTPTGNDASDTGDSERSVTPDYLRFCTPEYLRDYEWEAQMEELNRKNDEKKMEAEEREVKALLVLDADDEGDALMDTDCEGDSEVSDGLEYVPDSEEDLLLSPRGLRSRSPL